MSENEKVENTVLDTELSLVIADTAKTIEQLKKYTDDEINALVLGLLFNTASRLDSGLTMANARYTITESAKVFGFSASKTPYMQTSKVIYTKEPRLTKPLFNVEGEPVLDAKGVQVLVTTWTVEELLSVSERVFRNVGKVAKTVEGAPSGLEGVKATVAKAKTVDALIKTLPPVEARKAPEPRIKPLGEALAILTASIRNDWENESPEVLQSVAMLIKLLSEYAQAHKAKKIA